jgi:hypothetical protein
VEVGDGPGAVAAATSAVDETVLDASVPELALARELAGKLPMHLVPLGKSLARPGRAALLLASTISVEVTKLQHCNTA